MKFNQGLTESNRISMFCHSILLIVLLALITILASAQPHGVITGRVVTEEGAGLPGITLTIQPYSDGSPSGPGASSKTITSDAEGNFQFMNLPPRNYTIIVQSSRGYVLETPFNPSQQKLYRIGDNATIRMVKGGVITGRVLDANGNPVIGIYVNAIRIRDTEGKKTDVSGFSRMRLTDDRGIYRIYGLRPGTYLIATNFGLPTGRTMSAYGDQSPTYHPSSTLDTAVHLSLSPGAELTNVDIRHRGSRGYAVSGKVVGGNTSSGNFTSVSTIILYSVQSGALVGLTYTLRNGDENAFAIYSIADGDYEVIASGGGTSEDDYFRSEPRRISVRGSDVTGIELRLLPMASIAGNVVLETKPACDPNRKTAPEEIAVTTRIDEKIKAESLSPIPVHLPTTAANEKGDFRLVNLPPVRHRLETRLPNENLFIKSITVKSASALPATANSKPSVVTDVARSGALLKPGERLTGVTITIADGAASLRGKVQPSKDGGKLPARLRVHLIPAEPSSAEDVLRFGEVLTSDGAFAFTNLAPGKYLLLARAVPDNEPADRPPLPAAWDSAERLKLRREAEAAKIELDLKPCQRVKDFGLRF